MTSRLSMIARPDALIYSNDPADIFYATGARVSRGILYIHAERSALFLDPRYLDTYRDKLSLSVYGDLAKEQESFLQEISFSQAFVDPDQVSYTQYEDVSKRLGKEKIKLANCIREKRLIKDDKEIASMRMAGDLACKGIQYIEEILKPGISEADLALQFEIFVRGKGAAKSSFEPIIAFGENSANPHHRPTARKLRNNEAVVIDAGVVLHDYCSDLTRSLWFGGENAEYIEMKNLVDEALERAIALCKPGMQLKALSDEVQNFFTEKGVLDLFKHSLGHSIGIAVHEWPIVSPKSPDLTLQPGMIFCLEPGLYKQNHWGIRSEEMILIKQDGAEKLCFAAASEDL